MPKLRITHHRACVSARNGQRQAGNQRRAPAAIAPGQRRHLAHGPEAQLHPDIPEENVLADHQVADLLRPLDVLPGVQPPAGTSLPDWIDQPVLLPFPQRLGGDPHQAARDTYGEEGVRLLLHRGVSFRDSCPSSIARPSPPPEQPNGSPAWHENRNNSPEYRENGLFLIQIGPCMVPQSSVSRFLPNFRRIFTCLRPAPASVQTVPLRDCRCSGPPPLRPRRRRAPCAASHAISPPRRPASRTRPADPRQTADPRCLG